MINLVLLVMVEVVWVLGPPTSPFRRLILAQTHVIEDFGHLDVIPQNTPSHHIILGIRELAFLMVLCLVLLMVILELVRVLGSYTSPPIKLIFGLMVAISRCLRVEMLVVVLHLVLLVVVMWT